MTPMQEQYKAIKLKYASYVVLFRLGDFYEAFNEDAKVLSEVLGITLTARGKTENKTPMAGIPHHALNSYLPKLIQAGIKIAIADQLTEAVAGKLVEREVTKVITPGTVLDDMNSLDQTKNNYISSVANLEGTWALALTDIHSGSLEVFKTHDFKELIEEIKKRAVSELLVMDLDYDRFKNVLRVVEPLAKEYYDLEKSYELLLDHFQLINLKGFGIEEDDVSIVSLGSLLRYLHECHKNGLTHIRKINSYNYSGVMNLDSNTIKNLEILYSLSNDPKSSVYSHLDRCKSAIGKRYLRHVLITPLTTKAEIQKRLDSVEFFTQNHRELDEVQEYLSQVSDIERISAKLGTSTANPKDLVALKQSIIVLKALAQKIIQMKDVPELIQSNLEILLKAEVSDALDSTVEVISESILEDPSSMLNEGGIINDGFDEIVDEYRSLRKNAKKILLELQQREIQNSGIPSLKVSFNKVFGYYIEVTKTHFDKVPQYFIRKQTLANAERYITQELKEIEEKLLAAEETLIKREFELFLNIRTKLSTHIDAFLVLSRSIANLDLICAFALVARINNFVKPEISNEFEIKQGRHIVVEALTKNFTPNDTTFSKDSNVHVITGPNMSGKSTYIRQVALLCLLAQIGSFVPASSMKWQIVDRIFSRVGASDNLSKGESTFMVEMIETANILNNATQNSLVILDEVGRGTSTYDGVAIAWSMIEYIASKIKAKTLFATHYHELTALENELKGVKNYTVEVSESGEDIIFKHKIKEGSASRSYGVFVAKLAGVPLEVVKRSNEILKAFEANPKKENSKQEQSKTPSKLPKKPKSIHPEQLGLI